MPSERVQRQIDRLLDQCEEAIARRDWDAVLESVAAILVADPENADALTYRSMGERGREAGSDQRQLRCQHVDNVDQQWQRRLRLQCHANRGQRAVCGRGGGCERGQQTGFDQRQL